MSLKTDLISPLLHRVAHVSGLSTLAAKLQSTGRILMFHGIDDFFYSVRVFKSQLTYLARHFKVVTLTSMVRRVIDSGAPAPDEIALTFDDGLRNNFTVAYPILRDFGVPATFFVCPQLTEEHRWQWTHEIAERLRSAPAPRRLQWAREFRTPAGGIEEFMEWMKTLPKRRRLEVEKEIRDATPGFQLTEEQRISFDPMNWEELLALDPAVITIGSHTLSHPILPTLDPEEAMFEIYESRRMLEERLGRAIEYFCYPDGAYNDAVVASVRKHYRAAVIANPGGFLRDGCDAHLLPRVPAVPEPAYFTWRLHRPAA